MAYILALDQGTTSSRAILFDEKGCIVASAQEEINQIYPQPAWVEHDPEEIWRTQIATARRTITESGCSPSDIAAIGIANQRETTVVWERDTGQPIYNAIVWQDRRTAPLCEELKAAGAEDEIRRKTGLLLDPYFSATKIRWLLDQVPGARQRAERGELACGTVDSWLLFRAAGVHVTDVTNASRTLLYNLHTLNWDEELLDLFRIPRALLPCVCASSGFVAEARPDVFGTGIPICGVAGDQQAATFGQTCFRPGMLKNTYGTGAFLLMNTGAFPHESTNRLLTTVAWATGAERENGRMGEGEQTAAEQQRRRGAEEHNPNPSPNSGLGVFAPLREVPPLAPTYTLEGSVFAAGAAIQWLRDGLGVISSSAESEGVAASVPDSAGVYMVPAFAGLGAPHWDSGARAAIVGLTRGSGRAHIVRAALDAACYQTRDIIEAMQADCGETLTDLRVDGGMAANNLMLQIQADVLGIPVHRPAITETTALGAAYLAGLAAEIWPSLDALAALWRVDRTFEPRMSRDQRESLYAGWRGAVARVRG